MPDRALKAGLFLIFATAVQAGLADEPSAATPGLDGVRPELMAPRQLCSPNRPITVQFLLRNTSDKLAEIPVATSAEIGGVIALPLEVVFGTAAQPALSITYREEKPVPVPPPATEDTLRDGVLKLAPGNSVGLELDLRDYYPALRYSGAYRLEWRPLGGQIGATTLEMQVESRKEAIMVTDKGKLTFTLEYEKAPRNVDNFLDLVRQGFYDGKPIHRIVPGFLIQAGCPKGDGTGIRADGKVVPAEFNDSPVQAGTLLMARKPSDPNSASCQFIVTLARLPELDGRYTVIGQATNEESLRTLNTIATEPTDRHDRPRVPLVIRSINLVEAEERGVMRFDVKPSRLQNTPPPATQAASAKP